MEIPTRIRFDVFLIVVGIALIILPIQFEILRENIFMGFSLFFGLLSLYAGATYIKNEYDMEMELTALEYAKQKREYMKYFEKENLLAENTKERKKKEIIAMIN